MVNGRSILIVDDSMTARKWTSVTLRRLCNDVNIIEASDGDEALAAVESNDVDAMLVDLNMPGSDGFEICERLLACQPGRHVAIVTANVQQRVRERAASHGYQFIAKPVNEEKLMGFLEACEKSRGTS